MRLLHVYGDLMNLYGDYANVAAVERMLTNSGEQVTTDRVSIGGNADWNAYDFVYIGSGTERNLRVALADCRKYTDAVRAYIDSGRVALLTGNSFEMLGKTITGANGEVCPGLGLFDFTVTEQNKTRETADVIYTCDFLTQPLVGFVNKCSDVREVERPLFEVTMGLGNCADSRSEGVRRGNCFGTHLTGPVLIKNPHFLAYLVGLITGKPPVTDYLRYEKAGYEVTLRELKKRAGVS